MSTGWADDDYIDRAYRQNRDIMRAAAEHDGAVMKKEVSEPLFIGISAPAPTGNRANRRKQNALARRKS